MLEPAKEEAAKRYPTQPMDPEQKFRDNSIKQRAFIAGAVWASAALAELSAIREEEKSDTAHIGGWRLDPQPDRFSKEEGWVYVINGPNGEFLTVSSDCQTYSGALVDPRFAIVKRMVYAMNAAAHLSGQSAKVEGRYTQQEVEEMLKEIIRSATDARFVSSDSAPRWYRWVTAEHDLWTIAAKHGLNTDTHA